jgi:hypothetical protein
LHSINNTQEIHSTFGSREFFSLQIFYQAFLIKIARHSLAVAKKFERIISELLPYLAEYLA